MTSYYDSATGAVPRPAVLLDKRTADAHDDPTLRIDADGYLWIVSTAHGTGRPRFPGRRGDPTAHEVQSVTRIMTARTTRLTAASIPAGMNLRFRTA